jgi:hypothetical protein
MSESQFSNLPQIITLSILEYALILSITRYYQFHRHSKRKAHASITPMMDAESGNEIKSLASIDIDEFNVKFHETYESHSLPLTYVLLITRLISLGFILGIAVIAEYILTTPNWFYFTNWNTKLISLYFLVSSINSVVGLCNLRKTKHPEFVGDAKHGYEVQSAPEQSPKLLYADFVHCLFEVCGGTSIFIAVVDFALLNRNLEFWNLSCHLATVICLMTEMILNTFYVRLDHFIFNVSWASIYLIVVWIFVYNNLEPWPYNFMDTSTPACYFAYTALVLGNFLFYFTWFSISELKRVIVSWGRDNSISLCNRESATTRFVYQPVTDREESDGKYYRTN